MARRLRGSAGTAVHSATKAALTHFSSGLRADLEGLPIGTTVVEVGVVPDTEMGERYGLPALWRLMGGA